MRRNAEAVVIGALLCACSAAHPPAQPCVAELGCPDAREPAPCGETGAAIDVEAAQAQREARLDQEVTVRGFLAILGNACTRLGCIDTACCNRCDGQLVISSASRDQLRYPLPPHIGLSGEGDWTCTGDETAQCCAYRTAAPVIVHGTLEAAPGTTAGLAIRVASLCGS